MNHDALGKEARYSEQLFALEEAIASGKTPPPCDTAISAADQKRLRQAKAILFLLEFDRRNGSNAEIADPPPTRPELMPGSLGGFKIERELGRGGYGIVYLALDTRLKRRVALKVPRAEALFSLDLRRRFLREARAAADLEHPHLTPVYEVGEEGPYCFLVSRYCAAGSLADYLRNVEQPIPVRAAADLVAKIADAVEYMHCRGLLHRDIKPSNILLEGAQQNEIETIGTLPIDLSSLHPRLGDFGLVKWIGTANLPPVSASLGSHALLGTPAYMAPEQAQNESSGLGAATDVYSLGALLYELLLGRPPFSGSNVVEILQHVLADDPPPLRRARPEVPRDLETDLPQMPGQGAWPALWHGRRVGGGPAPLPGR